MFLSCVDDFDSRFEFRGLIRVNVGVAYQFPSVKLRFDRAGYDLGKVLLELADGSLENVMDQGYSSKHIWLT